MPTKHFDEPVAATYDDLSDSMFAPEVLEPTLDVLADLAGPGRSALELAVGTGRVALPLAGRGVRVHGIELSPAMLRRLHAKLGSEQVTTTEGDMTSTRVEGRFTGDEGHRGSTPFRYVWPSELDLMARLAGMSLVHRWAGWDSSPFTADSPSHVSVWRLDG